MEEDKVEFLRAGSVDNKSTRAKGILRLFLLVLCVAVMAWLFARNSQSRHALDLENIPAEIKIPTGVKELRLQRGGYQFFLQKKETLVTRPYLVVDTNIFWKWQVGQNDPINIYSVSYELLPYEEKYRQALEREQQLTYDGNLVAATETAASQREVEQLERFIVKMQNEKISVAILPANSRIRTESKKIRAGDVVKISGIYLEHSRAMWDGATEPLSQCLSNVGLFYVTTLYREK